MCLNAGTVMWYRHPHSDRVLEDWWRSTMDSYSENPLKRKFRTKWPWEQDRQMALFHRAPEHIQIASHPDYPMLVREKQDPSSALFLAENSSSFDGSTMLPDRSGSPSIVIKEWCLSHLPGALATHIIYSCLCDSPLIFYLHFTSSGCGCFINHFCANPASKQKMRSSYSISGAGRHAASELPFRVHELIV